MLASKKTVENEPSRKGATQGGGGSSENISFGLFGSAGVEMNVHDYVLERERERDCNDPTIRGSLQQRPV